MKRSIVSSGSSFTLFCFLLITCLCLAGCWQRDATLAEREQPVVAVQVVTPQRVDMQSQRRYPCQIRPQKQIAVTSKLAGKVSEVFCEVSDYVRAGEALFALDTVDIQNSLRALTAQLATADAAVRAAETGVSLATGTQLQSQILQASGGVQMAQTGVEQAGIAASQSEIGYGNALQVLEQARLAYLDLQGDLLTTKRLYEIGEVTRRQLEQLEMGVEQAFIRLSQAELGLEQAELTQNQARVALSQAEASLAQASSSYELVYHEVPAESLRRADDGLNQAIAARDAVAAQMTTVLSTLDDATVRAPIEGVVASRGIESGMMIAQSTLAFTIIDMETVYATINVSENLIATLSPKQEVAVSIKSLREEAFLGHIDLISPAATAGGAFEVRVCIANSDSQIKSGMYAEVVLIIERQDQVLCLPRAAVLEDAHKTYVYLVSGDHAERREVVTGIEADNQIAILSGLQDQDRVVIKGQQSLNDGALVNVVQSEG